MNTPTTIKYLALGDSYTVGEGLPFAENFPSQTQTLFNQEQVIKMDIPKIIAVTGWTTDELSAGIDAANIDDQVFDFVSLLIGVNNQYRGRDLAEYEVQFTALLERAIAFSKEGNKRVFVLSIPDWGITPFAQTKAVDAAKVAQEIDAFNQVKQKVCKNHEVHFIDITPSTRIFGKHESYLVADGLHYGTSEYGRWAKQLAQEMQAQLEDENRK